jgi:hypothetical protein
MSRSAAVTTPAAGVVHGDNESVRAGQLVDQRIGQMVVNVAMPQWRGQ